MRLQTAKIIDDAVTNALIATDAVNQDSIAANSVTASEIVANTITASEIAASTITSAQIAANTITAGEIAANTITASEMNVTNLSSISADLGSISGGSINIGSGNFTVSTAGVMTATGATISGQISATTGAIGGFSVGSTSLTAGSGSSRISLSTADGIHLGDNTFSSAPFRVALDGSVTATNATITGALTLTNIDGVTVTYTAGSLTVGTISAGNLGNDAIFPATLRFERSSSTSAPSNAEFNTAFGRDPKNNDIVVVVRTDTNVQEAYKHNGTSFAVVNNYIDGDLIVNGTISTDQIATNAVTANEILVTNLAAISANMGSITSGSLDIGSGTFTVDTSGNMVATSANITGAITATSGTFAGSLSSASGTFTGALSGGTISIGSGNSIFKADSNGIYLGNATFGSAPFRVTPAGELTATSVTVTGKYNAKNISGTGQAGLFSQLSDSVTGGSDPLRILCPSDDSDKDFFILMGNDPYSMAFSSGIPTSANLGLWFTGTGSIYMGGTNDSFSPLADNSNDLGRLNNRWDDIYATNGTIQTSDANDKSNIADADLGLSFVSQLTPRKYTLNDGDSKQNTLWSYSSRS